MALFKMWLYFSNILIKQNLLSNNNQKRHNRKCVLFTKTFCDLIKKLLIFLKRRLHFYWNGNDTPKNILFHNYHHISKLCQIANLPLYKSMSIKQKGTLVQMAFYTQIWNFLKSDTIAANEKCKGITSAECPRKGFWKKNTFC